MLIVDREAQLVASLARVARTSLALSLWLTASCMENDSLTSTPPQPQPGSTSSDAVDEASVRVLLGPEHSIDYIYNDGTTPLIRACRAANLDRIVALVLAKADLSQPDTGSGRVPLHEALIARMPLSVIEYLLHKNASVETHDRLGRTPLMHAVSSDIDVLQYIHRCNPAALNAVDHAGHSAVHIAARRECVDALRFLIHERADVLQLDGSNHSPLDLAPDRSPAKALLLQELQNVIGMSRRWWPSRAHIAETHVNARVCACVRVCAVLQLPRSRCSW